MTRPRLFLPVKVALVAVATPIAWTAAASYLFVRCIGGSVATYYPDTEISKYWQWWGYLLDERRTGLVTFWLILSAIPPTLAILAIVARRILDMRQQTRKPLYGDAAPATREQMKAGGLEIRRR